MPKWNCGLVAYDFPWYPSCCTPAAAAAAAPKSVSQEASPAALVERKWNSFLWTSNDDDKRGAEQYLLLPARGHVTFVRLLFLQRWRRRWFVLQQGKLPRQYLLNYFTDETKKRLKGSIALDECEQVRHDHSVRKSTQKSLILQRLFPQLNPNSPTPKSNHKYYLKWYFFMIFTHCVSVK